MIQFINGKHNYRTKLLINM